MCIRDRYNHAGDERSRFPAISRRRDARASRARPFERRDGRWVARDSRATREEANVRRSTARGDAATAERWKTGRARVRATRRRGRGRGRARSRARGDVVTRRRGGWTRAGVDGDVDGDVDGGARGGERGGARGTLDATGVDVGRRAERFTKEMVRATSTEGCAVSRRRGAREDDGEEREGRVDAARVSVGTPGREHEDESRTRWGLFLHLGLRVLRG